MLTNQKIASLADRARARLNAVPAAKQSDAYVALTASEVLELCGQAQPSTPAEAATVEALVQGSSAGRPGREVAIRAIDLRTLCNLAMGGPIAAEAATDAPDDE